MRQVGESDLVVEKCTYKVMLSLASFRAGFAAVSSEVLTQVDRAKGRITISPGLCFQMDIEHPV